MKTTVYNPSHLEIEFAEVLKNLRSDIEAKLKGNEITDILINTNKDNPDLVFKLVDKDGDHHELVVKIIQRAE